MPILAVRGEKRMWPAGIATNARVQVDELLFRLEHRRLSRVKKM
jgi:hypothetical protein